MKARKLALKRLSVVLLPVGGVDIAKETITNYIAWTICICPATVQPATTG